MIPETIGKNFYPNSRIPLLYSENNDLSFLFENKNYLSIIYIQKGSGSYKIGNNSFFFNSPLVLCLNEKVHIDSFQYENLDAKILTFYPNYINDFLTFDIIHEKNEPMPENIIQDFWLVNRLFYQNDEHLFQINLGFVAEKKISWLMEKIKIQYIDQLDVFWPCRGKSYFFELLFMLERSQCEAGLNIEEFHSDEKIREIYPVIQYLNNSYQNKITISNLVKIFNTNRTSLREKFIRATGFTPINYLIKIRIQTAIKLLEDTSIPISEIIERIGFDDLSNFRRMFKKHTGLSPSVYREKFTIPNYINR